jgi:hypothetical protein
MMDPAAGEPDQPAPSSSSPTAPAVPEGWGSRFKGWVRRQFTGMTLVALAGLAASLGWKPFERNQPQAPIAVIERPARRDLSTENMRDGLLALLPRRGAKVQVNAIVEPEAMRFKYDVQRVLVEQGFDVLSWRDLQVGPRPILGQNVYEADGVFVIEIGSDDGSRVWTHGSPIFPGPRTGTRVSPSAFPSIDREKLFGH